MVTHLLNCPIIRLSVHNMTEAKTLLELLREILELGWPALATIFLIILWRRLNTVEAELHDCLKGDKPDPGKPG